MALLSGKVEELPFCYEAEYFDDGSGFMSIGVAKEVDKMFKTKRSKGQGTEGKIDKKKVAYGVCRLSEEGFIEFCVVGGMMKPMEAKKCIKSIPILKKKVGDKYKISKGINEVLKEIGSTPGIVPDDHEGASEDKNANKANRSLKLKKMNENVGKMDKAVGSVPKEKLDANIQKYETALVQLINEAKADGEIDPQEQAHIDELQAGIDALKANIAKQEGGANPQKLTPERKEKIKQNMDKIKARLEAITKKIRL